MLVQWQPGGQRNGVGVYKTPFFAPAEVAQTISPVSPIVAVNGTIVFATNLPANWTASCGSIVAAPDGLSATYTAPGAPTNCTVTATNQSDPGNTASTVVQVMAFGPYRGEFVPPSVPGASRSIVKA